MIFSFAIPAHYYGKRRNKRIGRPPGVHSNLEADMKKPNKRRKRRKHFVHKKKRSSTSVDNSPAGSPQASSHSKLITVRGELLHISCIPDWHQ